MLLYIYEEQELNIDVALPVSVVVCSHGKQEYILLKFEQLCLEIWSIT